MKVFISSVITGYDDIRQAAVEAIEALDHSVIRAEDFVAWPQSAEVACLSGIRNADIVLVILGARYGHKQTSGMSATHQEFFEAKHCEKIVFVFAQSGVTHEPEQRQFIDQAQDWAGGVHTGKFDTPASLRAAITKALVRWERRNVGQTSELVHKAVAVLPDNEQYSRSGATLAVSVAVGPSQTVLRPTELEDEEFGEKLQKLGQFGSAKILDRKGSTDISVNHHTLIVSQSDRQFSVAEDGTVCVTLPLLTEDHSHFAILEEDVLDKIESVLKFCALLLDEIGGTERISSVVPACRIIGGDSYGWSTRAEMKRNRSVSIRIGNERDRAVLLAPPMRSRAALRQQPDKLSYDLMVLLRRQFNLNSGFA